MTAEATPRSSLLFAMGKLTAETNQHGSQIAQQAAKMDALPDLIALRLKSRFDTLEETQGTHGKRLTALEQKQWWFLGGGAVLLLIAKPAIDHLFK